jgi:polyadenylate-binding protein 2
VTILKEKLTGKPKGCAYIEFAEQESVDNALMLSGTILRKRPIKISQKRTNIRGMSNNRGMGS